MLDHGNRNSSGPARGVARSTDGRLDVDLSCVRCGYNLRGLKREGVCGECGTPIDWTLRGGGLRFADPDWLGKLRAGAGWMVLALPWLWFPLSWPIFAFGFWQLTTAAPGRGDAGDRSLFFVLRALIFVLFAVLIPVGAIMNTHWPGRTDYIRWSGIFMVYVLSLFLAAWVIHRLAQRADAKGLRGTARVTGILCLTASALLGGGFAIEFGGVNLMILAVGAGVGFLLAFVDVLLGGITLILTWRLLVAAEFQARAGEREPKLRHGIESREVSLAESLAENPEN